MFDTAPQDADEIIAVVTVSKPRRYFALATFFILAALLVYIALVFPPADIGWRVFLLALGGFFFWATERMRRATALSLILTRDVLCDNSGTVLAQIADIERIERGVFALKPSNGFMLKTTNRGDKSWKPGVWWRNGRRIGVGGVTHASQTKSMAEIITMLIAKV